MFVQLPELMVTQSHLIGHHVEEVAVGSILVHPFGGRRCATELLLPDSHDATFAHESPGQNSFFHQSACKDGILTSSETQGHNSCSETSSSNRPDVATGEEKTT